MRWPFLSFRLAGCVALLALGLRDAKSAESNFDTGIASVLIRRCLECHHTEEAQGGLDLSTEQGLRQGGESGAVIVAGDAAASRLWQRVSDGEMPPSVRGVSKQLPAAELEIVKAWIAAGAPWPAQRVLDRYERTTSERGGRDWWSLQPIQPAAPPPVPWPNASASQVDDASARAIDAFVAQRLLAAGLVPAPPADRRTLMRRAYLDLWGIPPSADELDAFAADPQPNAYTQLIDRLLASPHYGERWGRHWLDVVRFAETCGYERDQLKPHIWKYRDWVIQALHQDMPYDRFVQEQLAGDELPDRTESTVIATGMLRAGTWNDEPNDPADYLYERLEDMVHTTTTAFLGLTVKCARCHDHKFDPISQEDYYRLGSFFWAGYLGQANLGGPTAAELGYDVFGWTDRSATVEPIRLLMQGERHKPGAEVAPGFLSAVTAISRPIHPPAAEARTTTRRLQFAQWLTDPKHPLTARVIVNRLWQHHFGQGLVRSVNNFGFKGDQPTHPELLDWLAADLMEHGWRLKRVHRMIMLSATYQQSCDHPQHDACAATDFANRWIWHWPRQRLDAESLRDALLSASGELQRSVGGPSFYPTMSPEALEGLSRKDAAWTASPASEQMRRTVYMISVRSRILPLMTTFDFCDTTMPCGQRDVTTVPTQALALLNNDFVHERSAALAARLTVEAPDDPPQQVIRAFRAVLGRNPHEAEQAFCLQYLHDQSAAMTRRQSAQPELGSRSVPVDALASLCHVLMNSHEFIHIE